MKCPRCQHENRWGLDWEWQRRSFMRAMVVDILHSRVVGTVNGYATGTSRSGVAFILFVIPIPYGEPSFPEGPACRELGVGVEAMLGDETEPTLEPTSK